MVPWTGSRDEEAILVSDIWRKYFLMKMISNASDIYCKLYLMYESGQTLVQRPGGRDEEDILVSDIWQ